MYSAVLTIHSWLRWITLLLAIGATLNALRPDRDLSQKPPGRQWDTFFMMALDVQVLFGLLLYLRLSALTNQAMNNPRSVMDNPTLWYWAVYHLVTMFGANVTVRIGRVLAIGAKTAESRRRWRFAFFAVTTALIVAGIPWPSLQNGRPLFRF